MTMRNETVVSLADLRYVSITCPDCNATLTLDTQDQEKSEFRAKYGFVTPTVCPGCQKTYDPAIKPRIEEFQKSLKQLTEIPGFADRISFRAELPPSK